MCNFGWFFPVVFAAALFGQEQQPPQIENSAPSPPAVEQQQPMPPQPQQPSGQPDQSQPAEPQPQEGASPPAVSAPGAAPTPTAPATTQPSRDVSFTIPSFARNFFSDQKKIWTFPARVVTGHDIVPVLAVSGITAAIVWGVDPIEGRYFRRHVSTFTGFNNTFSEHRTTAATLAIPGSLAGLGLITRHSYLAHTGLLALEAWVDVDITSEVMRNIADRRRPEDIPLNGNYSKTWFKTASSPLHADGSFPSGHTGWGFAVASVVARRYPKKKWVTALAYGLATVDLASRMTANDHFASDTVFGAILGYSIGRFVVLRQ